VRGAILSLGLSVAAAGCVHPFLEYEPATESAAASGDDSDRQKDARPVAVAYDGPVTEPAVAPTVPPRMRDRDPVFFRLGAGYGALGQVDLSPCRELGLPRGYLRVRVTFHTDGRVGHAALQSDVLPPAEALTCVGERLELASVPAFEGGDVTLSKSFFVD
jgi:hypothetical protein